ncbi:tail fiber protein [Muribaculum intestinale]|uniref:tail fiber protein n=1 Tax=Muribaculum intestinale TaxID=1796646 RepID=UPI0025A9D51B|nr:tail fiber protein [Muribaculum intestinale]
MRLTINDDMMDKITGNYLTQVNKDFPLDCETLDYLQRLVDMAVLAGNIAGDRVVLYGCEANSEGTHRGAGYVFVRTRLCPEGEILYWTGGSTTSGMYVQQDDIFVMANNIEYPKAYSRRRLAPGIGEDSYSWDDFTDIMTVKELMAENLNLRTELAALQPPPLGVVQMWAGATVPEGYLLCNGQELRAADYPELYQALGNTFNTAASASGTRYTTPSGYFRLPDLRGRFVVGRHDSDSDYSRSGAAGGIKAVALDDTQIPGHSHLIKDYMMIPKGSGECREGTWRVGGEDCDVGYDSISDNPKRSDTAGDNRDAIQWIKHRSEMTGGGKTHENRPPYYVLAYIMRAK